MLVFFIFLLFITIHESKEGINMKIYKDQILTSSDTTETMRNLQYNKIYINSRIGSNDKSIKLYLRFNEYITYITDNYYKKEESNSYEFTRRKEGGNAEYIPNEFQTDDLNTGYESKDKLKLDDNILKDFNFILVDKLKREKEFYYPIIGLNLVKENNIRQVLYKTNFLEQLKSNNLIDNKIFSILYYNKENKNSQNEKGEIIFGKLPHELTEKEKFGKYKLEENNLFWDNAEIGDYNLRWKLKFERIKFGNQELSEISGLIAELIVEQNVFTGTWEFKNIIHQKFFEELINKKICKEEKFYNYRENFHYFFYSCDSSLKSELSEKKYMENILQFKSNSLNEIFSFNLEELFIEVGRTLYFSIIFDEYQMYGWKLGNIFFEKYPLVFSLDNKAIGYYNQNLGNMNKASNKTIYILIGLILLLLIILFIGFRRYNILKKLIPRKLMANELLDDYSYNSNNINNEDNNKNEIRTEMAYKTQISKGNENKLGV